MILLKKLKNYLFHNLLAIDQLANTLSGGHADETLSSRSYRADIKGRLFGKVFRRMIDFLFFFEKNHCYFAYMSEIKRKQLPPEFQEV